MARKLRLDHPGIGAMLKSSEVAAVIDALGVAAGAHAEGHILRGGDEVPVLVGGDTTDRAVVRVTLAHPAGGAVEAKYGLLAKAAAAQGLEVTVY
jgi:hypothetical protein